MDSNSARGSGKASLSTSETCLRKGEVCMEGKRKGGVHSRGESSGKSTVEVLGTCHVLEDIGNYMCVDFVCGE